MQMIVCGPADATATPSSLAAFKCRKFNLSSNGLSRLTWKKSLLNQCLSHLKWMANRNGTN